MSASAHDDTRRGEGCPPHGQESSCDDSSASTQDELNFWLGLWLEAPFARLPDDAPSDLYQYLEDVQDPRQLYAVHHAARRRDFQLLVDRFIHQLRVGCGSSHCTTPSCFTCRKRLVANGPVRRHSPTSARMLAVYLASREDFGKRLCPYLQRSNEPPPATSNLIFSAQRPRVRHSVGEPSCPKTSSVSVSTRSSDDIDGHSTSTSLSSPKSCQCPLAEGNQPDREQVARPPRKEGTQKSRRQAVDGGASSRAKVRIGEKPSTRDHRSFAAALFGTTAFKMLEWLTPQSLHYIYDQCLEARGPSPSPEQDMVRKSPECAQTHSEPKAPTSPGAARRPSSSRSSRLSASRERDRSRHTASSRHGPDQPVTCPTSSTQNRPSKSTRNDATPSRPTKRSSMDATTASPTDALKSTAKATGSPGEIRPRASKLNSAVIGKAVPDIPKKQAFFENVPCPPPPVISDVETITLEQDGAENELSTGDPPTPSAKVEKSRGKPDCHKEAIAEVDSSWTDYPPPQVLHQLNVELVDFICDVFQEDRSSEKGFFWSRMPDYSFPLPTSAPNRMMRKAGHPTTLAASLRKQWKMFNEQSIFHVMSNPRLLVRSFTRDGKLFDSHTLWYCMFRMTRTAPSLVLHSLWLAAKTLFVPPPSLKGTRIASKKPRLGGHSALSDFEAGCVMSICLHALVAAVPCVPDNRTLYEMSRIRSSGRVISNQWTTAGRPSSTCLDYDAVFSNELALRLARRIFRAITARNCFAEIAVYETDDEEDAAGQRNVLGLLLNQLDLIGNNGPVRILEFSQAERQLHETRVPTLLLDWARAVLLHEWNGRLEYSNESPIHGAMALVSTLYENRNRLLVGDIQFRVDYLSERLDALEVPITWMAFNSTRQMHHILDHPYLFSPDSRVSFFRAINFARMSRSNEESNSLRTRMAAIIDPGSLVTNAHYKRVLQDSLKTASSRFLMVAVSREHAFRDALDQLWGRQERELLRPLKVRLGEESTEEGFDLGGVQLEFFGLVMAACFDPDYGAFTIDERTKMAWFVPGSLVEEWKFEMIGLLFSLAVYNGLTLPVNFPKALYQKLLGAPVEEPYQITDGWYELAKGLVQLQEWDEKNGAVEEMFALTYEFSVSAFGGQVTVPMQRESAPWPQGIPPPPSKSSLAAAADLGEEAPLVTNENRYDYVRDYVRYLTDVSVRPQFRAFERGFRACLDAKSLTLLTPSLLQAMVEGVREIDVQELRRSTHYSGWDASHPTVKDFWSIVKRYDDKKKRKLLEFVTASDRVPVGGIRNVQFSIQRNGEETGETGHLPTAYTCYGVLLLPQYDSKEILRERLDRALEYAHGFGMA